SRSSAERLLPAIPEPLPWLGPRLGVGGDDDRLLRHNPVLLRRPGRTYPTRAGLEPRPYLRRLLDLGPDDRPPGPAHRAARGQARGARLDVHRLGPRWRRAHRDLAGARAMAVLRGVVGRDRTLHGADPLSGHLHGDHQLVLATTRVSSRPAHAARRAGLPHLSPTARPAGPWP